ncbi:MAG: TetR/AcrR family transcriptional regulator [Paracoccaceae bacterium]
MARSSTLRDRRRQQTAREIQKATLNLILRHGYASVTTEMIAAEAGISPRTFFNYYTNKEAASAGDPPDFPPDVVARFVAGEMPLAAALAEMLTGQIRAVLSQREMLDLMVRALEHNPQLMSALDENLRRHRDRLGAILSQWPGGGVDTTTAGLLADLLMGSVREAVGQCLTGQRTEAQVLADAVRRLRDIGGILAGA